MAMASNAAETDPTSLQNAQEKAVGITTFTAPTTPGFRCIVKQRYTDFLVNEILPNGTVLHLSEVTSEPGRKRKREDGEPETRKKPCVDNKAVSENPSISATGNGVSNKIAPETVPERVLDTVSEAVLPKSLEAQLDEAMASISVEDQSALKSLFGDRVASAIFKLYSSVISHPDRKPRSHSTVMSEPFLEKSKRTEAHMCIRRIFQSKLETMTIQDQEAGPSGSVISIKAAPTRALTNQNQGGRNNDGQSGKQNWADLGGEYLHFTLYKENRDTMEVLSFIASQLKMHMKHFSFAGTKDRRGVTVQRVAIHRVKRERVESLNRNARGYRVGGPWEYRPDSLDLGMLGGNEFLLTLRDVQFGSPIAQMGIAAKLENARTVAKAAAKSISASGFLNYYGLQRFGSYSSGTHVTGMRMLSGDLRGAIDSILSFDQALLDSVSDPADREEKKIPHDDIARAAGIAAFLQSGDSREALTKIPGRFSAERSMVTHLGKYDKRTEERPNKNDFQGALMSIQRNLRLMYVHAYQSFVWNTVAARRWKSYGDKVIEGDLVVIGEKDPLNDGASDLHKGVKQDVDEHGEPIIHPSASANPADDQAPGTAHDDPYVRARSLTSTEAESGHYNVFDIVLPLPGYDVLYPGNDIGTFYQEFMSSEQGGGLDPHNMRRAWKDISLSGGYRKMMARPLGNGVQVDIKMYGVADEQMVETDLEKLEAGDRDTRHSDAKTMDDVMEDKIAVILKMQLGSSQYATMALRELTKGGAVGYRPDFSAANR